MNRFYFTVFTALATLTLPMMGQGVSRSIRFDQLGAEAGKDYKGEGLEVKATAHGASLRCDFQKLHGRLAAEGLWLESSAEQSTSIPFRVRAQYVGRGHTETLPAQGKVEIDGLLARYFRSGVIEEYSVSIDGIRQDFLIEQKPAGSGPLRLELAVDGAKAEVTATGADLILDGNARRISYSRLHVTDATGRALAARMEVISASRLTIVVEDIGARYPLRIDPTFSDANWLSMGGIGGTPGPETGFVYDFACSGTNLYVAGSFSLKINNTFASGIAKWDGSAWTPLGSGMTTSSTVYAVAVDKAGKVYVGGDFTTFGGVAANRVAKWNGSTWSALGSGFTGDASTLISDLKVDSAGNLFAAGSFSAAGGISTRGVAKWNGSAWSSTGLSGSPCHVLEFDASGVLYGGFQGQSGVRQWDGATTWTVVGSGLSDSSNGGHVYDLKFDSAGNLYAGGAFSMAGSLPVKNIARWNGSSWSGMGTGMSNNGQSFEQVTCLAIDATGNVYAGGNFVSAGGVAANGFARWDGTAWSAMPWYKGSVKALCFDHAGALCAGGSFSYADGICASNIAKWKDGAWSAFGIKNSGGAVQAMVIDHSGNLYIAGAFASAAGIPANNIAKWDGYQWSVAGLGLNGFVYALAVSPAGDIFAGGNFTKAGGVPAPGVARWDGTAWSALPPGPNFLSNSPGVTCMTFDAAGNLFVGGNFNYGSSIGFQSQRIVKWDGSSWSGIGAYVDGSFDALRFDSAGNLYAGGMFTQIGNVTVNNIAKWNGSSWSALGSGVTGSSGGYGPSVNALAFNAAGNLYVGGLFLSAGGGSANNIAKWNGTSWSSLGTGTSGDTNRSGEVFSMTFASDGNLFVGGEFLRAGGVFSRCLAKWDGTSWSALGGSGLTNDEGLFRPNVASMVFDTAGNLLVGGAFGGFGGKLSSGLERAILGSVPYDLKITPASLVENNLPDAAVGTLSASDWDDGGSHSFALVPGNGSLDNDSFRVDGTSLRILLSADYETKTSYSVRLRATDPAGHSYEKPVTIQILNGNDAPTGLSLSSTEVVESSTAGSFVANLTATDPDAGDSHTFSLTAGEGSEDNSSFVVAGNVLRTSVATNHDVKSSYSIRLRATDSGGAWIERSMIITIADGVTLEEWATLGGLSSEDAGPDATPFDDGVPNLLKYAFNMNASGPDVSVLGSGGNSGLPLITVDQSEAEPMLRVEFLRRRGSGLVYTPERSDTLNGFVSMTGTQTVTPINAEWERVSVEESAPPTPSTSGFARLRVTLPE